MVGSFPNRPMLHPTSFRRQYDPKKPCRVRPERKVREIVFFGRLEIRKGLKLFCDTVDELCADSPHRDFEVTFLGKETQLYGRSSIGYISDRSKAWNVPWHLVANKNQKAAIEYLREDGRLAVVSSLADNFPNTALECVGAGVPLLVSNVGGIPEIIDPADRENVCFEPRPDVLAERIRSALEQGAFSARPSASFADTEGNWVRWHAGLSNRAKNEQPARKERAAGRESIFPLVSVCFAYNVREKGRRSHVGVAEAARLSASGNHCGRVRKRGFVSVKGIAWPVRRPRTAQDLSAR